MQARPVSASQSLRRWVYDVLEFTPKNLRIARWVNRAVGALIVVSVAAVVLDTVPSLHAIYGTAFYGVDALSLLVLSIEYGLRIWVAPEHIPSRQLRPWRARLEYVSSPQGLLDLAVVMPLLDRAVRLRRTSDLDHPPGSSNPEVQSLFVRHEFLAQCSVARTSRAGRMSNNSTMRNARSCERYGCHRRTDPAR